MTDIATMTIETNDNADELMRDADVARFLRANPEFFITHPEVVAALRIPHETGVAISLIEHQIKVVRDQNRQLNDKLGELIQIARDNDRLNERLHRFVLDVMDCKQLDELLATVHDTLRTQFDVDAATICLLGDAEREMQGAHIWPSQHAGWQPFSDVMQTRRIRLGQLPADHVTLVFPGQVEPIRSCAVMPLFEERNYGLLAIGSHQPERYKRAMGTVFLNQIGALVSRALKSILGARPVLAADSE